MEAPKKLIWWKKPLYILVLMFCLLLGGAERGGYLFSESLSIIGYILFYVPLISVIGFAWEKIREEDEKRKDEITS